MKTIDVLAKPVPTMEALALQVGEVWVEAEAALNQAFSVAKRCGELLIQLREEYQAQFGEWGWDAWRSAHVKHPRTQEAMPSRTAQLYQRIWENREKLEEAGIGSIKGADRFLRESKPQIEEWIGPAENHRNPVAPNVTAVVETAQKRGNFTSGSTALVVEGKHKGELVRVAKVEGGAIAHSTLPSGQSFPFLVGELELVEAAPAPEKPVKVAPKDEAQQLKGLLRELYCEVGAYASAELRDRVEAALGG